MSTAVIIILIVLGLLLILLEMFVTPGVIIGILGVGCWIYALFNIYNIYGKTSGHLALAGLSCLLIACIVVAVKSGIWNKVSLNTSVDGKVNELPVLEIGQTGTTLSMLRPSGKAIFDNNTVEVTTLGEMVEAGKTIRILRKENNIYIVESI